MPKQAEKKKLSGSFNPTHDFEKEKTFTGEYQSTREVKFKKGKREQTSNIHTFLVEDEEVDIWGSAIIDSSLSKIEKGAMIEITYRGKGATKDGAKLNLYDVFKV